MCSKWINVARAVQCLIWCVITAEQAFSISKSIKYRIDDAIFELVSKNAPISIEMACVFGQHCIKKKRTQTLLITIDEHNNLILETPNCQRKNCKKLHRKEKEKRSTSEQSN